jgi:hypothetical protein
MAKDINIGPRITPQAAAWLEENFPNRNAGAEFVLDAFPSLYKRGLKATLDNLSDGEKKLIIDLHNAYFMTPQHLGQGVSLQVRDGIDLDGMDKKWHVARTDIVAKLESMTFFELACLEIWATAFWQAGHWEAEGGLEKYVRGDR